MLGIQVEGLHKSFIQRGRPDLVVLDGVTFSVEPGSFVCLLGPSGSGKSVTLHLIGGLLTPDRGRIAFATKDGSERAAADVRLGFVFQSPRLLPWMTIDGNLRFVLEGTGLARDDVEDRIATVLELMGLADFRRYHPHQLSGGMQQRVAIARALAFRPDVILMDEPFSHLDEITARLMRAEMTALWQRTGTTVLFVTHDLAEACFLAQRILLLTPKPTRVHEALTMDLPYPRVYGTDAMFDAERHVLRKFEASISVGLNPRQKERLGLQPSAASLEL